MILGSGFLSGLEIECEYSRLSDFDTPRVHKFRAVDKSLILLRATLREVARVVQFERKNAAGHAMNRGHAILRLIQRRHAVNPRIHVLPIEGRKPENTRKFQVE
jgi:hypothetical protein